MVSFMTSHKVSGRKDANELSKAPVPSNPVIYFRRWSYSVPKSISDGSTEPGTSNESCGGKYET